MPESSETQPVGQLGSAIKTIESLLGRKDEGRRFHEIGTVLRGVRQMHGDSATLPQEQIDDFGKMISVKGDVCSVDELIALIHGYSVLAGREAGAELVKSMLDEKVFTEDSRQGIALEGANAFLSEVKA